jgi:hypothetical protein
VRGVDCPNQVEPSPAASSSTSRKTSARSSLRELTIPDSDEDNNSISD